MEELAGTGSVARVALGLPGWAFNSSVAVVEFLLDTWQVRRREEQL